MNSVFICHATDDRGIAQELGEWLARNTPAHVDYTVCGEDHDFDLLEGVEQSLGATGVVVLLSPASAPSPWVRAEWEPLLFNPEHEGTLAYVQLAECRVPALLKRQPYFVPAPEGRRALKRWLLAKFRHVALPAPDAGAGVDDDALEHLRAQVMDEPGEAIGIDANVARAFARQCARDFEGMVWLDATRRTRAGLIGDLCHALGLAVPGTVEDNERELQKVMRERRIALVLENAKSAPFPREGKCSIILSKGAPARPKPVSELATVFARWGEDPAACLPLLRDLPAAIDSDGDWEQIRQLGWDAVALLKGRRERAAELVELLDLLRNAAWEQRDEDTQRKLEWERSWLVQDEGATSLGGVAPGEQLALFG